MGRVKSAVAFSGRIKSGKTSIAKVVSQRLSLPFASFGDYVRSEAEARGKDPDDRLVLQELGQQFVNAGLRSFCENVLKSSGWKVNNPIVVDGVRHLNVLKELTAMLHPIPLVLVYANVDNETQSARFAKTQHSLDQASIESHSTEVDVKSVLLENADLIVDSALSVECSVDQVLWFLNIAGD